jgi:hypothetical protein
MDYKRSARREETRFIESKISYREDNPIKIFRVFQVSGFRFLLRKTFIDLRWLDNV